MEKAERDDGNNTNPLKMAEDKFLAMAFLECADPVRYKTLWYSLLNNSLTSAYHYPKTLTYSFNLLNNYRPPVTHTIPQDGGGKQIVINIQFIQIKVTDQKCEAISGTDWEIGLMLPVTNVNVLDTSVYSALIG